MPDVLFVCYGNLCRSPMAEGLLDARLDALLGPGHGVTVASAGVGAFDGAPATDEAREAMSTRGIDVSAHRSRRLTPAIARGAGRIYCMEPGQVETVRGMAPSARVELLGTGIPDPIGCQRYVYDEILAMLDRLIAGVADAIVAGRGAPAPEQPAARPSEAEGRRP